MQYELKGNGYSVWLAIDEKRADICGGSFHGVRLLNTPILSALVQDVETKEETRITASDCDAVDAASSDGRLTLTLLYRGISFRFEVQQEKDGLFWTAAVENESPVLSVLEVGYPLPRLSCERFDLFHPGVCGKVIKDADACDYSFESLYPEHHLCMQYFAVYNERGGIYLGVEDPTAAVKFFSIRARSKEASVSADFYGIGGTLPFNSFALSGGVRWQAFTGDWYDATMIYSDFVHHKASWLPKIDENGRPDTAERFKAIPFWVCDYIPNAPSQGENKPMRLSAGSDSYAPGYWYDAVIRLQKALGVPIAYHVYNWHKIPFNIEYPHFLPAKDTFAAGLAELKKHDISVMPYINAVSWEMHDGEMGHAVNYENTGYRGAVLDKNGETVYAVYPQKTKSGKPSDLAPMCPSFEGWHEIIDTLSRRMEAELDIDGIYYDQISAEPAHPCYNPTHSHKPGGGAFWVEGYNQMMARINERKPKDRFYFSECNAEPYIKSFDGYLTWIWAQNGEVPAFPAIYGGYIQMLGRYNLGPKKEDYEFFKYSTARALLSGQQLGWCKADIIDRPDWFSYLKRAVTLRYRYTDLWNKGRMLRPPHVKCSLHPTVTEPASLWFEDEDIVMERVYAGAWQYRSGERLVIFVSNLAEEEANATLTFPAEEYALGLYRLPSELHVEDGVCRIDCRLDALEIKVFDLTKE